MTAPVGVRFLSRCGSAGRGITPSGWRSCSGESPERISSSMPDSKLPPGVRGRWTVPLPLLLLALLDLTFNFYFWRIPKLTPPWSDFGYEFLRTAHVLEQRAPLGPRVIAFGSSTAGSFNPMQIEALLNAADPSMKAEVDRLVVPGIKPSDSV